jgi:hypothetical protein
MQYLLLIHESEANEARMTPDQNAALLSEYHAFTEGIQRSGKFVGANRLQPTTTATTVRVRNGKAQTTDGPFAETREQLAGYYLVEATDLDEAVKLAAKIPSARTGAIEVRPIWPMPDQELGVGARAAASHAS